MNTSSDEELFRIIRDELFSAVLGDVLDVCGFRHQFLPPEIRPLRAEFVMVGRAMPVIEADLPEGYEGRPFGKMLDALDDLKAGDVYLAAGGSADYAFWGEIMSTRAKRLGSAGAVLHGYSRDTRGILKLNFPVFSRGAYAQDQMARGYVTDFRVPITIGKVTIAPGDLLFGDLDGVLAIPREAESEVLSLALEKVRKERTVQSLISSGMGAGEAFDRYGVL